MWLSTFQPMTFIVFCNNNNNSNNLICSVESNFKVYGKTTLEYGSALYCPKLLTGLILNVLMQDLKSEAEL